MFANIYGDIPASGIVEKRMVNFFIVSWIVPAGPQCSDCGRMLEALSILPGTQDFRARMPEKGDCKPWMAHQSPVRTAPRTEMQNA